MSRIRQPQIVRLNSKTFVICISFQPGTRVVRRSEIEEGRQPNDVRQNLASKFGAVSRAGPSNQSAFNVSPTTSSKRRTPEGNSDVPGNSSSQLPEAKLRRSQSAKFDQPVDDTDVFASASQPVITSSSKNTLPKGDPLQLQAHIIAHCPEVQQLLDSRNIAWGVQYEIARGVSCGSWTWKDVTLDKVQSLQGTNVEAATMVANVMLGQPPRSHSADLAIW